MGKLNNLVEIRAGFTGFIGKKDAAIKNIMTRRSIRKYTKQSIEQVRELYKLQKSSEKIVAGKSKVTDIPAAVGVAQLRGDRNAN